ncbi:hypothetical protein HYE68_008143 [Fusarium pseudograminearum]|nr:hypothetical protein HYE68_008143 [Fusarium pseudograminearum]
MNGRTVGEAKQVIYQVGQHGGSNASVSVVCRERKRKKKKWSVEFILPSKNQKLKQTKNSKRPNDMHAINLCSVSALTASSAMDLS